VGMRRGDVVYGGFVWWRLRGNGKKLCGCWKPLKGMVGSNGGVVGFLIEKWG